MLVDTEASAENEANVLAELTRVVDGVVLTGSRQSDAQLLEVSRRIPLVVVNREIRGVQSVVVDTSAAVAQALSYLTSLGHTRTVFLGGPADSWSGKRRWEALQKAAAQLRVECVHIGPFTDHVGPFTDMQSGQRLRTRRCITEPLRACSSTTFLR